MPCGEVPWQSKRTADSPNISSALPLVALVYLAVVLSCQQFREILYNIFGLITEWFLTGAPLNYISLHSKSHQKVTEFINQLALGIFGGLKRTLVQIYTLVSQNGLCCDCALFVARRGMSNLRAFLGF